LNQAEYSRPGTISRHTHDAQWPQIEIKEPRFPVENTANAVVQLTPIAQDRDRTIHDSCRKSSDSDNGAAKSAAIDPELADLAANWASLPAIIKSAILAVARTHKAKQ
jgi:hypothetical protein